MTKTQVLFVRHGQSICFIDRLGIITDLGLEHKAKERINKLVNNNRHNLLSNVQVIYTSTDLRAQETAKLIAQHLDIGIITIASLRSVDMPEGTEAIDFITRCHTDNNWHNQWLSENWMGEDFFTFFERVELALQIIANSQFNNGPNSLIVVGHEETFWVIKLMNIIKKNNTPSLNWITMMKKIITTTAVPCGSINQVSL